MCKLCISMANLVSIAGVLASLNNRISRGAEIQNVSDQQLAETFRKKG